jgi:hypothetical protein
MNDYQPIHKKLNIHLKWTLARNNAFLADHGCLRNPFIKYAWIPMDLELHIHIWINMDTVSVKRNSNLKKLQNFARLHMAWNMFWIFILQILSNLCICSEKHAIPEWRKFTTDYNSSTFPSLHLLWNKVYHIKHYTY